MAFEDTAMYRVFAFEALLALPGESVMLSRPATSCNPRRRALLHLDAARSAAEEMRIDVPGPCEIRVAVFRVGASVLIEAQRMGASA